jgi:exodeoxyribonuclease V alpha subunit
VSSRPAPQVLEAVLERLTFVNEETGYTVARVATGRGSDLLTVVGALLGAQPGESLRMRGWWSSHPQYGRQFEVVSYATVLPATIQGIRRYLGSGLIKGIGPVFAERIVDHFGLDTLLVIEDEPEPAGRGARPGPETHRDDHRGLGGAEGHQGGDGLPARGRGVHVDRGADLQEVRRKSIDVVKTEPYRLAADVWGIGFKTADAIAQAVGIPHDSPERVKAGLQYTLSQATDNGHCYLPADRLIAGATTILEVPAELAARCLDDLVAEEGVVRETLSGLDGPVSAIYLVPFHRAELSLANSLLALLRERADRMPHFAAVDWAKALGWLRERTGTDLAPEQEQAVRLTLTSKVAVLTGGPGCGKSFTVRSIVELAAAKKAKILLVAPTGRAAKRLAELTGQPAATVHRLLKLQPGGEASYDRDNPLDVDLLVVDEASMLDLILANKLVKAVPPGGTCCWSATSANSPRSAPARYCGTCSPPTASPGSGSPRCLGRPPTPAWSPTPTASTPANPRSCKECATATSSPATTPKPAPN